MWHGTSLWSAISVGLVVDEMTTLTTEQERELRNYLYTITGIRVHDSSNYTHTPKLVKHSKEYRLFMATCLLLGCYVDEDGDLVADTEKCEGDQITDTARVYQLR